MPSRKQRIRQQVLRRHGLVEKRYGKLGPEELPSGPIAAPSDGKTLAMRLIENKLGMSIEEVLESGTLREVSELLGIDPSTVSKWRLKLGLRGPSEGD